MLSGIATVTKDATNVQKMEFDIPDFLSDLLQDYCKFDTKISKTKLHFLVITSSAARNTLCDSFLSRWVLEDVSWYGNMC